MRKIILLVLLIFFSINTVLAAKIPEEIKNYVNTTFPKTEFRFDGVIILPDATIYLPLFPAKPVEVENIEIKSTLPANKNLIEKPDAVIFNNDYVLLKVIKGKDDKKTIISITDVPDEIRNGLLPQDMLVPRGLVIPENLKGIIGNLKLPVSENSGIKVPAPQIKSTNVQTSVTPVIQLKNKTFYITTGYSKNIQVVNPGQKTASYALVQNHVPNCMKGFKNKFLLLTEFGSTSLKVISLADEDVIKEILFTTKPDEILIDDEKQIAYVSSPEDSSIYLANLESMTLTKQIKINGMCEKLTLSEDGTKIFYVDKKTNEIWAIELDNNYLLKDIGKFPNVSKIAFSNDKLYITSRTKNHLAIIDYGTNGLIAEVEITEKPTDMLVYKDNLFILGAAENVIQVVDTKTDEITDSIYLNTKGFSTNINHVEGTDLAIISDTKVSIYCVLDMNKKEIIKVSPIEIPIRGIVVTDNITKINK